MSLHTNKFLELAKSRRKQRVAKDLETMLTPPMLGRDGSGQAAATRSVAPSSNAPPPPPPAGLASFLARASGTGEFTSNQTTTRFSGTFLTVCTYVVAALPDPPPLPAKPSQLKIAPLPHGGFATGRTPVKSAPLSNADVSGGMDAMHVHGSPRQSNRDSQAMRDPFVKTTLIAPASQRPVSLVRFSIDSSLFCGCFATVFATDWVYFDAQYAPTGVAGSTVAVTVVHSLSEVAKQLQAALDVIQYHPANEPIQRASWTAVWNIVAKEKTSQRPTRGEQAASMDSLHTMLMHEALSVVWQSPDPTSESTRAAWGALWALLHGASPAVRQDARKAGAPAVAKQFQQSGPPLVAELATKVLECL